VTPTFDLQAHSVHSDGVLAAADVVGHARAAGVELLALTDHDTVGGVEEALGAGAREGIAVVPAAEISAVHDTHEDLHILGYGIDHRDPGLLGALEAFREDRAGRASRMTAALRELGLEVDEAPLERRVAAGEPVGRPHLAQAVFGHPANRERLAAEGLADPTQVLVAYLIPGAPAYRGRTHPTVPEAIETIHAAGGVAVWAHPFWDLAEESEVVALLGAFAAEGLDGVEAFYPSHDRRQTDVLADAAEARDMLTTGSADFHGPEHPRFSAFRAFELHGRTPRLGPIAR